MMPKKHPRERPFFDKYFRDLTLLRIPDGLEREREAEEGLVIEQRAHDPPHYAVRKGSHFFHITSGPMNALHTIIVFLVLLRKEQGLNNYLETEIKLFFPRQRKK